MKRNMIIALSIMAMICSFCIAQQAAAAQMTKTVAVNGEHTPQIGAGGFQQIKLAGSQGESLDKLPGELSSGSTAGWSVSKHARLVDVGPDMFKVLSVIESRTSDRRLLEKVKDKLSTMSDDRLHVAASLSERAADDDRGAKTEIAFFLLTTLIIFS